MATGFSSCEDLLTEEPNSKYDRDRYFDSEDKAEMAMVQTSLGLQQKLWHTNSILM